SQRTARCRPRPGGHPALLRRPRRARRPDPRRPRAAASGAEPSVPPGRGVMRRILWVLLALAVAVVGAGSLALRSPRVQDAIVERIARRRIGRDMSGLLAPGALRVYGPDGVTELVHGFAEAYAADTRFRVAHHGPRCSRPIGPRWSPCPFCWVPRTRPACSTRMASS